MWRRKRSTELDRLLKGRPNFRVCFSRTQVAASLWDYGEDAHAHRALTISDSDLKSVQAIAAWYEDPNYPLPMSGQRITHHHVTAFAAVTFFEGRVRALQRTRRRPQKDRPAEYTPLPAHPQTGL